MWHELGPCGLMIQIHDKHNHVEQLVTDEKFESFVGGPKELIYATLQILAEAWTAQYGRRAVVQKPKHEGEAWGVYYDNVIDGEVVEERRAIGAPRKSIEGR